MNTLRLCLSALLLLPLALIACDSAAPLGETATAPTYDARSADRCVNVRHAGLAELGAPVLMPVPPFGGAGGLPTPTEIGPYSGLFSSILTDEQRMGNGAVMYHLVHYFDDAAGNAFWTDDRAVCSPVQNDPATCLVNDRLTVVGGTGDFENASGFLHNRGLITLTDPVFDPGTGITTFGSLEVNLHGRVCGDGV